MALFLDVRRIFHGLLDFYVIQYIFVPINTCRIIFLIYLLADGAVVE